VRGRYSRERLCIQFTCAAMLFTMERVTGIEPAHSAWEWKLCLRERTDDTVKEHPYLTVAVRQGSFTDRSSTRVPAVNVEVAQLVVAQHLCGEKSRSRYQSVMDLVRGYSPVPSQSLGSGDHAKGGCSDLLPSSPALVSRSSFPVLTRKCDSRSPTAWAR
jgi:hypothetical protein